jgi:hypothetical protein
LAVADEPPVISEPPASPEIIPAMYLRARAKTAELVS